GGDEDGSAAVCAALEQQLASGASRPEGCRGGGGGRCRDARALGMQHGHGGALPSSRTSQDRAPDPPIVQSTTSAPGPRFEGHFPWSWCTPLMTRWICCDQPGWLNDIRPPSVQIGWLPPWAMRPSMTKSPPSPGRQNSSASN